jgi:putative endonuclease
MNPALPNKINITQIDKQNCRTNHPNAWYYVYLLKSKLTRWIYIGCTGNLKKRLKDHTAGKVYSTKKMLPVELLYYEAYKTKECAFERERKLKNHGSSLGKLLLRLRVNKKGSAG